jgi:hypothetical protein
VVALHHRRPSKEDIVFIKVILALLFFAASVDAESYRVITYPLVINTTTNDTSLLILDSLIVKGTARIDGGARVPTGGVLESNKLTSNPGADLILEATATNRDIEFNYAGVTYGRMLGSTGGWTFGENGTGDILLGSGDYSINRDPGSAGATPLFYTANTNRASFGASYPLTVAGLKFTTGGASSGAGVYFETENWNHSLSSLVFETEGVKRGRFNSSGTLQLNQAVGTWALDINETAAAGSAVSIQLDGTGYGIDLDRSAASTLYPVAEFTANAISGTDDQEVLHVKQDYAAATGPALKVEHDNIDSDVMSLFLNTPATILPTPMQVTKSGVYGFFVDVIDIPLGDTIRVVGQYGTGLQYASLVMEGKADWLFYGYSVPMYAGEFTITRESAGSVYNQHHVTLEVQGNDTASFIAPVIENNGTGTACVTFAVNGFTSGRLVISWTGVQY